MGMTQSIHTVHHRVVMDGATGDGDVTNRFGIIDCAAILSSMYGRNIRQGNVFKLVGFDVSPVAREDGQHEGVSMGSGTIEFMRPTKNRIQAWKNGLKTALELRKSGGLGVGGRRGQYDFRVGLRPAFGTVSNQAAFVDDDEIYLTHDDAQRGLFPNYNSVNETSLDAEPDVTSYDSFGLKHAYSDELVGDEDVNVEATDSDLESEYWNPTHASVIPLGIGWQWAKGGRFGGAAEDSPSWGVTSERYRLPDGYHLPVMCGLIGWKQTLAAHDDSIPLGEGDVYVDFLLHFSGWNSIMK